MDFKAIFRPGLAGVKYRKYELSGPASLLPARRELGLSSCPEWGGGPRSGLAP